MSVADRMKALAKRVLRRDVRVVRVPVDRGDELSGRRALVVGGTGGIGGAIAASLVAKGCAVAITGSSRRSLDTALEHLPDGVMGFELDVSDVSTFESFLADVSARMGGLDTVVYSAGVHGSDDFGSVSEDTWDRVMTVNLKGAYFICQEAGNLMVRSGVRGHILVVGSASALKPGWTPYEISKRGVQSFVLGAADRLIRHGVTVNCIAPGPVATKMLGRADGGDLGWSANPSGRLATAEEIAELAAYMVSDLGNLVIGDSFYITGGSGTVSNR
ncbi:SDR family oxidoreductase [Collinsella tanakaei]|nr:SDR family oxidoreductase [Collinsella tanakaei]